MKVKATIIIQSGLTGLRKVGHEFMVDKKRAKVWEKAGLVSIEKKELKATIETKELKSKRTTKSKK